MLTALAIATLAICPTVQFTSDSVYVEDNALTIDVTTIKSEHIVDDIITFDDAYMLILTPGTLSGYMIYDDPSTDYIDGLRLDNETGYVYSWSIPNFNDTLDHTIYVKTVYTSDFAGMMMQAKDGKIGALLSNPLTLVQCGYYILAGISLVVAALTGKKSKKVQVKNANDIAAGAQVAVNNGINYLGNTVSDMFGSTFEPVMKKMQSQNEQIIKALCIMQMQGTGTSTELLDMLKSCASEDLAMTIDLAKQDILNKAKAAAEANQAAVAKKQEAAGTIAQIASGEAFNAEAKDEVSDDGAAGRY